MDANRIAHIRRTLEATTAPPDVCTMGHYINIVSGSTPREVQADARFYRQAWFFVRDLLDVVDPQPETVRDGISGFADG